MNMYLDTSLCRQVFRAVRSHYFCFLLRGRTCRQVVLFPPKLSFISRLQLLNTVEEQREISRHQQMHLKYEIWCVRCIKRHLVHCCLILDRPAGLILGIDVLNWKMRRSLVSKWNITVCSLSECVCVCVCEWVSVCVYLCVSVSMHVWAFMCEREHVCVCVCVKEWV